MTKQKHHILSSEPLAYNSADPGQVSKAKNAAKFQRDSELSELHNMLTTYSGRRFLWRLLEQCGVYKSSFTGNSETFFREGQRAVGLWALAEINAADPDAYRLMQIEANEREIVK